MQRLDWDALQMSTLGNGLVRAKERTRTDVPRGPRRRMRNKTCYFRNGDTKQSRTLAAAQQRAGPFLAVVVFPTVFWTTMLGYLTQRAGWEISALRLAVLAAAIFAFLSVILGLLVGSKDYAVAKHEVRDL